MKYSCGMVPVLLAVSTFCFAQGSDVRVTVDEVKDNRTTGEHFASLDIRLRLMSDSLDGATQVMTDIKRATDDTGRDLIEKNESREKFQQIHSSRAGRVDCDLRLRNPARRATVVK